MKKNIVGYNLCLIKKIYRAKPLLTGLVMFWQFPRMYGGREEPFQGVLPGSAQLQVRPSRGGDAQFCR